MLARVRGVGIVGESHPDTIKEENELQPWSDSLSLCSEFKFLRKGSHSSARRGKDSQINSLTRLYPMREVHFPLKKFRLGSMTDHSETQTQ